MVAKYLSKLEGHIFNKCRHREKGIYYQFYEYDIIEKYFLHDNPSYFKNLI
jgi:hypothetical protein